MSKCQETAGFLIAAPCTHKASTQCQSCGKPICEIHSRESAVRAGRCCIACHRKSGAKYEERSDDPYLYAGFFYHDYYSTYDSDSQNWDNDRGAFDNNEDDPSDDWESDFDGS